MRGGEERGNKSNSYRKTDDNQIPPPPPLPPTRWDWLPQESIFPALAAKFACKSVYLYTESYFQRG